MDLIIRNAATLQGCELAVVDIGIAGTTIAAPTRPMARVSVSTPARLMPIPKTCAVPLMSSPTAVAGAIHERTVPGVPRLRIQPQPRPETSESEPMTATVMRPPRTSMRARSRHWAPSPAQSQAT